MKNHASLVNTARGELIENLDIIFASLKIKKLNSVALDVLPQEPPSLTKSLKSWKDRGIGLKGRLLINPHVAYYSAAAFKEMREKTAKML